MTDHLAGISVFVEVARAGSFTAAAERLGMTKSAVSKAVSRLEERLGDRLFQRSTRRISLTGAGETYLASCTAALDILRDSEAILGGSASSLVGRLRLDMPHAFGRILMVPLLSRLCREHPDLQLTLSFTDRVVDPFEEQVDMVIRFGRTRASGGLMARTLIEMPRLICASPDYLEKHGTPHRPEELADYVCIVGLRRGNPQRWAFQQDGKEVLVAPPSSHIVEDSEAIIALAESGVGLCQMAAPLIRSQLDAGTLVPVLDAFRAPDMPVQAVWPDVRGTSPRLRFLLDHLIEKARSGYFD